MSKFEKNKVIPKVESYISEFTTIKGSIDSVSGTLRIDGKVDGEFVKSKGLIVGEKAIINANLDADYVIISGQVNGNITVSSKIEILKTAKIVGNVDTKIITVEEGSFLQGQCKTNRNITEKK